MYSKARLSANNIDSLLRLWALSLNKHGDEPAFIDHNDLYAQIDSTPLGDVAWDFFGIKYTGPLPEGNVPPWMTETYKVHFRDPRAVIHNIISNPDFNGQFDYAPYQEYDSDGEHRYHDFMSGNWAWKQAERLTFFMKFGI